MVHIPSETVRSELLAVPEMPRLTLAKGRDGFEATLLIKASSLTLKYLVTLKTFGFCVFSADGNEIGYAIRIDDDPTHPAVAWSLARTRDEIRTLKVLLKEPKCVVFLFNEAVVSVAWGETELHIDSNEVSSFVNKARPTKGDLNHAPSNLEAVSTAICSCSLEQDKGIVSEARVPEWHPIGNTYITNQLGISELSIFAVDEGGQQETLALWLTDGLHPSGATANPSITLGGKEREFTDILLTYSFGSFLIESKTLSIFDKPRLPPRQKLTSNIKAHIKKASGQLGGALRAVRGGAPVFGDGKPVELELGLPPHVIILVPDLTLLNSATEFGGEFIQNYLRTHRAFLHILDTTELLRMVQAAQMIARAGKTTTEMMAFDAHLMKRFEYGMSAPTPDFDFLLRLV